MYDPLAQPEEFVYPMSPWFLRFIHLYIDFNSWGNWGGGKTLKDGWCASIKVRFYLYFFYSLQGKHFYNMELMDCGRLPLGVVKAKVRLAFSHAFFSGRVSAHFSDAGNNRACANKDLKTIPLLRIGCVSLIHQISSRVRTWWPSGLGGWGVFLCSKLPSGLNSTSPPSRIPMFP